MLAGPMFCKVVLPQESIHEKKPDSTYLILGYIWNEYHYKPSHFEFNSAVSAFWKLNSALLFSSVVSEL